MNDSLSINPAYYESGTDIETYLAAYKSYLSLVRAMVADAQVDPGPVAALARALRRQEGPVRATAHTEDWCGDWACTMPILRQLFQQAGIPFRVFDGAHHPELRQQYRDQGSTHIPVISLWDGQGREILRWIEAPAAVEPLKDEWKAAHPRLMELYAIKDGDKDAENEFARLYRNMLADMSQWYRDGLWTATVTELVTLAEQAPIPPASPR